jgi:hypothetical protein
MAYDIRRRERVTALAEVWVPRTDPPSGPANNAQMIEIDATSVAARGLNLRARGE